jgi:hypothetical protein
MIIGLIVRPIHVMQYQYEISMYLGIFYHSVPYHYRLYNLTLETGNRYQGVRPTNIH